MKTFLRENKLRLFLLIVPILCLGIIWNVNIYKIWWDYSPWKNLGSPPNVKVEQILRVNFPRSLSMNPKPTIYVYASDGRTYRCCSSSVKNKWEDGTKPQSNKSDSSIVGTHRCAQEINQNEQINLDKEDFQGAKRISSFGGCSFLSYDYEYAVYQIKQDGSLWEKYISSMWLEKIRENVSNLAVLAIFVDIFMWIRAFGNNHSLGLKPDYEAN